MCASQRPAVGSRPYEVRWSRSHIPLIALRTLMSRNLSWSSKYQNAGQPSERKKGSVTQSNGPNRSKRSFQMAFLASWAATRRQPCRNASENGSPYTLSVLRCLQGSVATFGSRTLILTASVAYRVIGIESSIAGRRCPSISARRPNEKEKTTAGPHGNQSGRISNVAACRVFSFTLVGFIDWLDESVTDVTKMLLPIHRKNKADNRSPKQTSEEL